MKKFFLIVICVIAMSLICYADSDRFKKIECNMYCKTQIGNSYREDITSSIFVIDDVYNQLYIYSNGENSPISGDTIVFNNNEISIKNIQIGKENAELNINRQSGTIFFKRVLPNKWTGDLISIYQGSCNKLNKPKF